jgi:hypothetical protein
LQPMKLLGIPLVIGPTIWLMLQRVKTSTLVPEPAEPPPPASWAIPAESAASAESK